MTTQGVPICWACEHFRGREKRTCKAFPKGIPDQIYWHAYDHRAPFAGDNGVQFKKLPVGQIPPAAQAWFTSPSRVPRANRPTGPDGKFR